MRRRSRTVKGKQRRKVATIVDPCGVSGAGHPEVLIDGGRGDDVSVHRGDFPVSVRERNTDHQPANESQEQCKTFHYRIHSPAFLLLQNLCGAVRRGGSARTSKT